MRYLFYLCTLSTLVLSQTANIYVFENNVDVESTGSVQGVQLTLAHETDFSIDLNDAYISEYQTEDNITVVILVAYPSNALNGNLFNYSTLLDVPYIYVNEDPCED